jgi:ATP-dependent Lon protease
MEVIELNSYTKNEKLHIAKEHLIEKQIEKNGLKKSDISFTDSAISQIIDGYTKEAGVRNLERNIATICRKVLRKLYTPDGIEHGKKKVSITAKNVAEYLGKPKYTTDKINSHDDVGIVRGLAWTAVGGDTLEIEVNAMPGEESLILTGNMGDVMKESARIALSYVRSIAIKTPYKVENDFFKKNEIHIHIPEGAVPKDGPSAGVTMSTAILSAVTGIPVRSDVAMTGEVTLRGRVLPIGGLKEKLLAAKTAGVRTVIVPEKNKADVAELDDEIVGGMEIVYADDMKQVYKTAFSQEN